MPTLTERFAQHGYSLEDMGGNCSAYYLCRDNGFQIHITLTTDAVAPESEDDEVEICGYDGNEYDPVFRTRTVVGEFLSMLDAIEAGLKAEDASP